MELRKKEDLLGFWVENKSLIIDKWKDAVIFRASELAAEIQDIFNPFTEYFQIIVTDGIDYSGTVYGLVQLGRCDKAFMWQYDYGSCTVCDTLYYIQGLADGEEKGRLYWTEALHIFQSMNEFGSKMNLPASEIPDRSPLSHFGVWPWQEELIKLTDAGLYQQLVEIAKKHVADDG